MGAKHSGAPRALGQGSDPAGGPGLQTEQPACLELKEAETDPADILHFKSNLFRSWFECISCYP